MAKEQGKNGGTVKLHANWAAFDRAQVGAPAPNAPADPLSDLYKQTGFWASGEIQEVEPGVGLPKIVEAKDEPSAKKLARAGGRPLHQADDRSFDALEKFWSDKDRAPDCPRVVRQALEQRKAEKAAAKAAADAAASASKPAK